MIRSYSASLKEVERELATNFFSGLVPLEAKRRLKYFGPNTLPVAREETIIELFIKQFQSPLIYVLLVASGIVFMLQERTDAIIILAVLIFNAILGVIEEGRSRTALKSLRAYEEVTATALRDGEELIIPDFEVVPGDILFVREGERVPADSRIIESYALRVDEAALTGESLPSEKAEVTLHSANVPVVDQKNMVFKGTNVVGGHAKIAVVATGKDSEFGKISEVIAGLSTEIPLKKDIRYLSQVVILGVGALALVIFAIGIYFGRPAKEMFETVVALSVSIVPEGLPIILTLILATGVSRMARKNALVKKLQAVEALGQARVIAVDKTGTLTKNEMIVRRVWVDGKRFDIQGTGYEPKGDVELEGNVIDPPNHPELLFAGKIASFCADAEPKFSEKTQSWQVKGDPTEAALFAFGQKIGFRKDELEKESPSLFEIPFDYKRKIHSTSHKVGDAQFIAVIGAPEELLDLSTRIFSGGKNELLKNDKKDAIEQEIRSLSRSGLRVIAFGFKEISLKANVSVTGLAFAGLFGLEDSLRPEVRGAIERAKSAGVRVVMITGDHRLTAVSIGKEAGIYKEGDKVMTGEDVEKTKAEEMKKAVEGVTVFARVTPMHKMKIIQAYKDRGEIIAMTGDGVNDAPSLVAADLGIAMGKIGTEVAKEAADIVILDDNFESIVSAIEEGRNMYKTIQKSILFLFSTGLGEVFAIAGAIIAGLPLPVLPVQILWLNLVTDPFTGAALALEPKESGLLEGDFKHPNRYLVDGAMIIRSLLMAITMMIGSLFLFQLLYKEDMTKALTLSLTTLAIFQWFNAYNCRSERKSLLETNFFSNGFLTAGILIVIILQLFAVYHPLMNRILHTTPLTGYEWFLAAAVSFCIVIVEELRKLAYEVFRPKKQRAN